MAATLGLACAFDLSLVAPQLPPYPTPDGRDEMSHLRHLVEAGGARRYGARGAPGLSPAKQARNPRPLCAVASQATVCPASASPVR